MLSLSCRTAGPSVGWLESHSFASVAMRGGRRFGLLQFGGEVSPVAILAGEVMRHQSAFEPRTPCFCALFFWLLRSTLVQPVDLQRYPWSLTGSLVCLLDVSASKGWPKRWLASTWPTSESRRPDGGAVEAGRESVKAHPEDLLIARHMECAPEQGWEQGLDRVAGPAGECGVGSAARGRGAFRPASYLSLP